MNLVHVNKVIFVEDFYWLCTYHIFNWLLSYLQEAPVLALSTNTSERICVAVVFALALSQTYTATEPKTLIASLN